VSICDNYTIEKPKDNSEAWMLACTSECHQRWLEMRLWINREQVDMQIHHSKAGRLPHTDFDGQPEYRDEVKSIHVIQMVNMVEDEP
jgi:hypothetical protein